MAKPILVPFLFAALLTVLGTAPVHWLQQRRVPTWLAVLLVAALIVGVLSGLVALMATSVNQFTESLPRYRQPLADLVARAEELLRSYDRSLSAGQLLQAVDPATLFDWVGRALRGLVGAVSSVAMAVIFMVFMLFEAAEFRVKLRVALDGSVDPDRVGRTVLDVQRYLGIKTVTSLITGVLVGVVCAVVGVDFAQLWALVAFLLNYVPFVGSIIAAIPAILLALVSLGLGPAVTVTLGYVAVNFGVSNFLEPTLMGRQLGLSPLVVFLALVFWGWIWGPAGMLLAVPLTMVVKILLEHSEDLRWVGILMGSSREVDLPEEA